MNEQLKHYRIAIALLGAFTIHLCFLIVLNGDNLTFWQETKTEVRDTISQNEHNLNKPQNAKYLAVSAHTSPDEIQEFFEESPGKKTIETRVQQDTSVPKKPKKEQLKVFYQTIKKNSSTDSTTTQLRRRRITLSTYEERDALYLEKWRQKIERIGNLNYPKQARRQSLYGSLELLVALKSDGTVERVEMLRSSGHKVLDQAALLTVNTAAPFEPLTPEMLEQTDILEIVRTWQFTP